MIITKHKGCGDDIEDLISTKNLPALSNHEANRLGFILSNLGKFTKSLLFNSVAVCSSTDTLRCIVINRDPEKRAGSVLPMPLKFIPFRFLRLHP